MNVTDYTYLMNKPDAITEKQAEALGSVLNEFPYFQSARALRLKGLYNQNSFKYNYALKVTAAHTTDRSVLFDFITSETFTSIQDEFYDRKIRDLMNISVYGSEIVSSEEFKKIIEVRIDPVEQSILDSIKEATGVVYNETIKTEDLPIEQSALTPKKEAETVIFDEPVKIEDTPIESKSFLVDAPVFYEEPVKIEEDLTHQIIEQPPVIAEQEKTSVVFEEVEETTFHPVEESKIIVIPDTTAVVWEEIQKSIEIEIDPVIEEPTLTSKETSTIVFEEIQKTNEVAIHVIEESDIISIPDTTAVVWEEEKSSELPIDAIEESKTVSTIETSNIVYEEPETVEETLKLVNEPVKKAEENLEIGRPLDFSVNETHSFQEWLQLARTEPIDRTVDGPAENVKEAEKIPEPIIEIPARTETVDEEKKKKEEIIDNFIKTNPKIPPIKQTPIIPTVQFNINEEENSYLMTETLARVYLEQKKYTKAIQAYEILILKYPEKISFFADRISDIKILQQNNNNN
ncbi:hypothetical protein [Flavobacterium piscis]|uniref:Tetratricopeptide repeat protein n=1 Tax=Flavobacterium piscis TaxID=1114874 RepID=A0ABU1Y718_9FLAO|nr:hypothetical protein [Flavobacterium piscis]MDR7209425.1 hypothetical protein [Flavobacterium piscis]